MTEGLTLQKTNMVLFNEEQLFNVLKDLEIFIKEVTSRDNVQQDSGEETSQENVKDFFIFKSKEDMENNNIAKCSGCKKELTFSNLGHIAHGSKNLYCKNSSCFFHFIANKKLR